MISVRGGAQRTTLSRHGLSRSTRMWLGMTMDRLGRTGMLLAPDQSIEPPPDRSRPALTEFGSQRSQLRKRPCRLLIPATEREVPAKASFDPHQASQQAALPFCPVFRCIGQKPMPSQQTKMGRDLPPV